MVSLLRRAGYTNVMATVAAFAAVSLSAVAAAGAVNGTAGVIHACSSKRTGALRLIAANKPCSKGERAIAWNQTGAPGTPGAQGDPGAQGSPGAQGLPGANGTAVAYAHVPSGGTLDTANSKDVDAVTNPSAGLYCLHITAHVTNASATVDTGNSGGLIGYADAAIAGEDPGGVIGTSCSSLPGANAVVSTAAINGALSDRGFWITLN